MTTQTITITNYNDVFKHVFTDMEMLEDNDLPEFWYEQPEMEMLESEYWQQRALEAYAADNDLTTKEEIEAGYDSEAFIEYEQTYVLEYLLDNYLMWKVSGANLDKLPPEIPVFYIEELESYVFLQGWYGMASYLMDVTPFTWEVKA